MGTPAEKAMRDVARLLAGCVGLRRAIDLAASAVEVTAPPWTSESPCTCIER